MFKSLLEKIPPQFNNRSMRIAAYLGALLSVNAVLMKYTLEENEKQNSSFREKDNLPQEIKTEQSPVRLGLEKFTYGSIAGFLSGLVVATPEYLKIWTQKQKQIELKTAWNSLISNHNKNSLTSLNFHEYNELSGLARTQASESVSWRKNWKQNLKNLSSERLAIIKSIPQFALLFAAVCALEFSVNEMVKEKHGKLAGWSASALTGAVFLTAADQIMYLHGQKVPYKVMLEKFRHNPSTILLGFTPMFYREVIYVSSLTYIGPAVGQFLRKYFRKEENTSTPTKNTERAWDFLGRIISGIGTTFLSQPFDMAARLMQINYHTHDTKLRFREVISNNSLSTLYAGAIPRIALAAMGAALSGYIYGRLTEHKITNPPRNWNLEEKSDIDKISSSAVTTNSYKANDETTILTQQEQKNPEIKWAQNRSLRHQLMFFHPLSTNDTSTKLIAAENVASKNKFDI